MSETVAPEAGIVPENDESKDVLPEKRWNEADFQHCKSRRAGKRLETGTANLAPPALQISHLWLCKCRRAAI